jgi:hypothetical protein
LTSPNVGIASTPPVLCIPPNFEWHSLSHAPLFLFKRTSFFQTIFCCDLLKEEGSQKRKMPILKQNKPKNIIKTKKKYYLQYPKLILSFHWNPYSNASATTIFFLPMDIHAAVKLTRISGHSMDFIFLWPPPSNWPKSVLGRHWGRIAQHSWRPTIWRNCGGIFIPSLLSPSFDEDQIPTV